MKQGSAEAAPTGGLPSPALPTPSPTLPITGAWNPHTEWATPSLADEGNVAVAAVTADVVTRRSSFWADSATVAAVDEFLRAYNRSEDIASWGEDSLLWAWNAYLAPDPDHFDQDYVERIGEVAQVGRFGKASTVLVSFPVEYGFRGQGFGATWVQEWSPTRDMVLRMWVVSSTRMWGGSRGPISRRTTSSRASRGPRCRWGAPCGLLRCQGLSF